MKLSIVIPVYNGASSISNLVDTVLVELGGKYEVEIVLVNDGSKDNSERVCEELVKQYPKEVVFIGLRRNSGEHNAVICGLNYSTGDYVAIIDDDFQNPPSEILKLLDKCNQGDYDVVYSYYQVKRHSIFRNLGSSFNGCVATWLLKKPKGLYLSSFKLIKKELVEEIIDYKGPFPYIDGLILRLTSNIGTQLVQHNAREEGKSNYTLKKLISLYLNMFLNFSILPIRVFTILGMLIFCMGFVLSLVILYEKIFIGNLPAGWAFLSVMLLMLTGTQFLFFGLIGEYLGKLFLSHNGAPQYVIKKVIRGK
ncbi:MAG: glycosyltransferase family 2 protein [Cytophagales bacterium]|nr:glycosyltransferase family 2 protein [Cytophagales bacterium]